MTVPSDLSADLRCGDCLDIMPTLRAGCADMVLCDLPYGTTACAWDSVIPFDQLWPEYKRLLVTAGTVALTASQPFTSTVVLSNPKWFRVEWIWEKNRGSNFATTKYHPMKEHESVLIFGSGPGTYNPIYETRTGGGASLIGKTIRASNTGKRQAYNGFVNGRDTVLPELRVPRSIQKFNTQVGLHPTQKPVALLEYLIRTYTNPGDTVLDNTMGSGSTGVACMNTGRNFIGIERDPGYFAIAQNRIRAARLARMNASLADLGGVFG